MIYFSTNLKILRTTTKKTQEELAKKIGVKANTISNYEKGISTPDYALLKQLSSVFAISADKLLYWDLSTIDNIKKLGESDELNNFDVGNNSIDNDIEKKIPFVNQTVVDVFWSKGFLFDENDIEVHYVIPMFKDWRIDFMIEVSGNSMYPKYYNGDVIACSIINVSKFVQWNKVYAIATQEHGLLVKRIMEVGNNTIIAVSDNPDYPPLKIPKEEITGTALVVGVVRLE